MIPQNQIMSYSLGKTLDTLTFMIMNSNTPSGFAHQALGNYHTNHITGGLKWRSILCLIHRNSI